LWVYGGYGLWILPMVVMDYGFCGGGGSMGLKRKLRTRTQQAELK
jgi:hypothetical protein